MGFIRRVLSTNPILFRNVITAVVALAVSFGVQIGDAETNAVVDLVTNVLAIGNLILSLIDRQAVFSPATHEAEVAAAYEAGFERGRFPSGRG